MIKKIFLLFLLFSLILSSAFSEGFRNFYWGESRESIKNEEQGVLVYESDELITYNCELAAQICEITYYFDENSLYAGLYLIKPDDDNLNIRRQDYIQFNEVLINNYGNTYEKDTSVIEMFLLDKKDSLGFLFEPGRFLFSAYWDMPDQDIAHVLFRSHFKMYHLIYYGIKDAALIKKDRMEEGLKNEL